MSRWLPCLFVLVVTCPATWADDAADYKKEVEQLKARVLKLENELQQLREQVAAWKRAVDEGKPAVADLKRELRLSVAPDQWGGAPAADVRAVCLSAANALWQHCPERKLAPIEIKGSGGPPMSLFARGPKGQYRVLLNVKGTYWAQCAYQFGHEFCHILCNYRAAKNPNLWFEESLCEAASLFVLRDMARTWKTNPPYANWKSYAPALANYAEERMGRLKPPEGKTLAQWYRENEEELRKTATDRNRNQIVAEALLPLLEAEPRNWAAVGYLNQGKADKEMSFTDYLQGWHERVPDKHKPFVSQVAKVFEIELKQ